MEQFLQDEIKEGALIGPFKTPPFKPWFHRAPFMSRPKASGKRRTISDLTFPRSHSVNAFIHKGVIEGKIYKHVLPSIDDVVKVINENQEYCIMFSEDLSRAYKNFRTSPQSYPLLVSEWNGEFYIETSMPFGARLSSAHMTRVATKITEILREENILCFMYLDDLLCLNKSYREAYINQKRVRELFAELGLKIATEKSEGPARVIKWLGTYIDIKENRLYIPQQKLDELVEFTNKVKIKKYMKRREIQSILGRTFYVGKCIRPVRAFTSRLLKALRDCKENGCVKVSEQVLKDVMWFKMFASSWNGIAIIPKYNELRTIYVHLESDTFFATDQETSYKIKIYSETVPENLKSALNVYIAFETFAPKYPSTKIRIVSSNTKTAEIFTVANSKDEMCDELARMFWLSQAHNNCDTYFGFKFMSNEGSVTPLSASSESAFDLPRIQVNNSALHFVFNFINRYKIQKAERSSATETRGSKSPRDCSTLQTSEKGVHKLLFRNIN